MRTTKLYKWLLPMMMMASFTAFSQTDSRTQGVFGPQGPQQGPQQNVPVVFPEANNNRYPAERKTSRRSENRDDVYRTRTRHNTNHSCSMPPGHAKKTYGGRARDYAHAKKQCGKRGYQNHYNDWNYKNKRR